MSVSWSGSRLVYAGLGLLAFTVPASAQMKPLGEDRPFWDRPQSYYREAPADWFVPSPTPRGPVVLNGGARPAIDPEAPSVVDFAYAYPVGSIVIDTEGRTLYLVQEGQQALAYEISVGRDGFTWTGSETISRVQEWPDWHPPKEMRERDRKLPEKMTGGLRNPLGAVALYLGNTLYRIHGTNDEKTIGQAASSGCFRMRNASALHLAAQVGPGTQVTVVRNLADQVAGVTPPAKPVAAEVRPSAESPAAVEPRRAEQSWRPAEPESADRRRAGAEPDDQANDVYADDEDDVSALQGNEAGAFDDNPRFDPRARRWEPDEDRYADRDTYRYRYRYSDRYGR